MRRGIAVAVVSACLCATAPATAGTTTVGVRADEWSLLLSRTAVGPGAAEIEYRNEGEDPHDLQIRRRGSKRVRSIAELEPGGVERIELRLKRSSRYVMWCSTLDGKHRALGMEAELRVRRR